MPTLCQTLAGAVEFDGTAGKGLFEFTAFNDIPRTTRVVLTCLSYSTQPGQGGSEPGEVWFYASPVPFGGGPTPPTTQRVLLGIATANETPGPISHGNATFCGRVLPRDPAVVSTIFPNVPTNGRQWKVQAFTNGKTADGTICVDYVLQPYEDTNPADSETPV